MTTPLSDRPAMRADVSQEPAPAAIRAAARCGRPHVVVGMLGAFFFLLGLAWVVSDPTPAGIDEPAHYIKALGHGQFELRGQKVPSILNANEQQKILGDETTRAFAIPAALAPAAPYSCNAADSTHPATCTAATRCRRWAAACVGDGKTTGTVSVATYVGTYEPTMYIVPGLMARLANSDVNGLRAARLGALVVATILIIGALAALYDRRAPAYSMLGPIVAISPMVVFLNSVVNPNGGEVAGALCFGAAVLRIVRDSGRPPGWVWAAAGAGGGLLACTRMLGTLWVIVITLVGVGLLGPRQTWRALRAEGLRAWTAVGAVVGGILLDQVWWQLIVGRLSAGTSLAPARNHILDAFDQFPGFLQQQIGLFGWGDTPLGGAEYLAWSGLGLALLTLAMLVGTTRQRIVLAALAAFDIVVTVGLTAITYVAYGFAGGGMEGRYVLAVTMMVMLLAGEIVLARHDRLGDLAPRRLVVWFAAAAAACQFAALWLNARRYAVGVDGPLFFLGSSKWRPPFGWSPWLSLGALGCIALVAAGVVASIATSQARVAAEQS